MEQETVEDSPEFLDVTRWSEAQRAVVKRLVQHSPAKVLVKIPGEDVLQSLLILGRARWCVQGRLWVRSHRSALWCEVYPDLPWSGDGGKQDPLGDVFHVHLVEKVRCRVNGVQAWDQEDAVNRAIAKNLQEIRHQLDYFWQPIPDDDDWDSCKPGPVYMESAEETCEALVDSAGDGEHDQSAWFEWNGNTGIWEDATT